MYSILDEQEMETRCASESVALENFEAFYIATGYYDVVRDGESLTVKLKDECTSLYPDMPSDAFTVRFVTHGGVTFFIAEKL